VASAVAGVAIGLAIGWVVARVRAPLDDPSTEISISFVTPYVAYQPAEALGASAVLAAVTSGIYLGWYPPRLISAPTRIQAFAVGRADLRAELGASPSWRYPLIVGWTGMRGAVSLAAALAIPWRWTPARHSPSAT
jgi:NhaP-type Na+/H+ or K+/H+ antiporter